MILNSESQQHQTLPYIGIPITQIVATRCDKSFLYSHAHIVGLQITIQWIILFVLTLYLTTNESRPFTASPTIGQQLVTGGHPPLRPATCHGFNRSICHHPNCTFPHKCKLCGANHSATVCTAPTEAVLVNKPKPTTVYTQTRVKWLSWCSFCWAADLWPMPWLHHQL